MKSHRDLPPGAQAWANDLDAAMAELKLLREVVKRLAGNAGLDYSNPQRGISPGTMPSTTNPVGQKLSSLADVQTYNVADKQVLTWSQQGQKWMPVNPAGGWELATEEEHLWGDLDSDSDYVSTQVMGLRDPYPAGVTPETGGTGDSYGLVGTSTTSAFLHGAQRSNGGPTKAHGYVYAGPYYTKMGVSWINDDITKPWSDWGQVGVDRDDVYITTPMGDLDYDGTVKRDGSVAIRTNWFYVPQVNAVQYPAYGINYPKRPVPLNTLNPPEAGAMVYDMTLKKHIQWNGTEWVDMIGNTIPAPLY